MTATTNVQVVINGRDNASHVIRGVGKSFQGLNQQVTSGLKKIGTFGLIGVAGLTAFATKAAFSAARVEELGFALNAIAKANNISQREVDKTVESLRKFNIAHDKALQVTSLFIQSELDLSDAVKLATVAKDLAVLASLDSSEATKELTRAIVTQRPILLKQFGIQKGLVEIYDDYAESVGKSATELTQAEKKQAFLNTILKEGKKVAGTYEAAMGSVSKRFRSLTGRVIPDFMAKIGKAFQPALTVVVDALSDSIEELSGWIDSNQETITEWGRTSGRVAESVVRSFGGFVKFLINNKEVVVGVLAAFAAGITTVGVAFVASHAVIIGIFTGFIAAAVLLGKAWDATGIKVEDLKKVFLVFWQVTKPIFEDIKRSLLDIWNSFKQAFGMLTKRDIEILVKTLVVLIGSVLMVLLVSLASTLKLVATGFKVISFSIRTFVTQVKAAIGWVGNLVNKLRSLPARFIPKGSLKDLLPTRQTGGIVPGPIGSPQPILAHGGEEIKPLGPSGGLAGGGLTLNVNIGTFIGSEHDKRNLAEEIMKHLNNIAAMQGKRLSIIE